MGYAKQESHQRDALEASYQAIEAEAKSSRPTKR